MISLTAEVRAWTAYDLNIYVIELLELKGNVEVLFA